VRITIANPSYSIPWALGLLRSGRMWQMVWSNLMRQNATLSHLQPLKELLGHWQATVIKGNAGEVGALAKSTEVGDGASTHPNT
jgi:hypothetical protein